LGLKRQTWWLACHLTDRYLKRNIEVKEDDLKLIIITCLIIAAKFEENPTQSNLVQNTDFGLDLKQIQAIENKLLALVDYNLQIPTANDYLNIFMTDFDRWIEAN